MTFWLWGAVFAFLGGITVGGACYLISRQVLMRAPSRFSAVSMVRNLIQVGYFLAVYFLAPVLPWDLIPLLVGAALGITLSTFWFTARLVKIASNRQKPPEEELNEEEPTEEELTEKEPSEKSPGGERDG